MYNESQKMEYLDSSSQYTPESLVNVRRVLNRISKFEEEEEKDFCFIDNKEKVLDILSDICGFSSGGIRNKMSMLKGYVKWCKDVKQLPNVSVIINDISVDEVSLRYVKHKFVADPADLQECMDNIFDIEDELTVDNVFRCFLWMAFIGINEDDMFSIQESDVDLRYQSVYFGGKDYPFPDEALDSFLNCIQLKEFRFKNSHYSSHEYGTRQRYDGAFLLRRSPYSAEDTVYNPDGERQKFQAYISMKNKKSGSPRVLTYKSIKSSGFFYRLYQQEKLGVGIEFDKVVEALDEERDLQVNRGKALKQLERHVKDEYSRWKKTFY